jgi:flagellar biosynthesis protein FliR
VIELSPIFVFGLALVRPSLLVTGTPLFGGAFAPAPIKVGLIVAMTALLAPVIDLPRVMDPGALVVVALREALIGLAIALSIRLLVAGAELGGHLTGFQLGLSYAALVDPQSGVRNNVLAALYGTLTVFVFLLINGHHDVLRAFAESYAALPVGTGEVGATLGTTVIRMFGLMFMLGVRLAAPLVITLLVVEIALGVLARVAPTLNLMVTAAPIRLLVGWMVLAVTIRVLPEVVSRALPGALELGARAASAFR